MAVVSYALAQCLCWPNLLGIHLVYSHHRYQAGANGIFLGINHCTLSGSAGLPSR